MWWEDRAKLFAHFVKDNPIHGDHRYVDALCSIVVELNDEIRKLTSCCSAPGATHDEEVALYRAHLVRDKILKEPHMLHKHLVAAITTHAVP